MTQGTIRAWCLVHKWTSLICTLFLLLLCVTGLPLIFHEEIEEAFDPQPALAEAAQGSPASLDRMVERPFETAAVSFDAHTGLMRGQAEADENPAEGFLHLMLRLHIDMFALLPGQLFLGFMGLLFLAALVSGVVIYGPFTRKLDFGTVRRARSSRVKWLDLHNLLGIVTLAWATVVGFTGALNELTGPLYQNYIANDVGAAIAPWKGKPTPPDEQRVPVDRVVDTVARALPEMKVTFVAFPGNPFGSPHHYFVWTNGRSALLSRLQTPALVDAVTGELTAVVPMPWYVKMIEISRPLHFGDYGGLPLKVIWALFDIATIVVLGSGLYLWIIRDRLASAWATRTSGKAASGAVAAE